MVSNVSNLIYVFNDRSGDTLNELAMQPLLVETFCISPDDKIEVQAISRERTFVQSVKRMIRAKIVREELVIKRISPQT